MKNDEPAFEREGENFVLGAESERLIIAYRSENNSYLKTHIDALADVSGFLLLNSWRFEGIERSELTELTITLMGLREDLKCFMG